ncbi:ABC transporter substrate-binding protein [Pseudomonas proteolytica]|uniref:ABC transporter substrate-binding protein n=1 Tax=Pseudomonas proteolytica TaxID=219574 RepID=UPI0010610070|nr:ABC transporter substrate-binding protein [Pseudomonas proteolytica]TDR41033.1 monosaccharide ABC transporter substrate-binding protein (CUT2 family) [Pseudomonas brenneri]NMY95490.1 substrate-binding domain-containing protein [Pseudomonas proteolytica]NMZ04438.1 substrate-binding domain-containing protein [Pseudomonas proteolytica]NMZ09902.1 substrate-binding domain-containing protein [Pseudomonas proteolytica]NMZ37676.1 substrate-binding domain-containing protein [Pseudomonas proteolytica
MLKVLCGCVWWVGMTFGAMAHATSVVFLNPGMSTEAFWVSYAQFMQAAAKDLGLDLRVRYSERDPQNTLQQAREALQGPQRPDYLVLVNEQYIAPQILRMAQGSTVKLLIVNNALTPDQAQLLDAGKYPNLLGSMVANDEEGGYLMFTELLRQYGPVPAGTTLDVLAFSGAKNTPTAQLREQGLQRALREHPQVHLRQLVYGEWKRERAFEQAIQMFKRYPRTALVWSANDEMALGAMQALKASGRTPGKDVLFSAVNSSPDVLRARLDGQLSALVAGHFTVGGWAMVLLHDDARGVDIQRHGGRERQVKLFQVIAEPQAQRLLDRAGREGEGVDFRALSAQGKPATYQYPFSMQSVLH